MLKEYGHPSEHDLFEYFGNKDVTGVIPYIQH